jgi:hypothetical protein
MNLKRSLRKHNGFTTLLCTAILLLLFPGFVRTVFYEKIPGGTMNYRDVILASRIDYKEFNKNSVTQSIAIKPYYALLHLMLKFLSPNFLMNFLAPLFGLLFLLFLYLILRKLEIEREILFIAMLMLILSSSFIWNFTVLNENSFILFILALGIFLFLTENKVSSVLGFLILIMISFGNLIASIVGYSLLILFLFYRSSMFAYKAEKRKRIIFMISSIFLILTILNIYLVKERILNENKEILTYFSEITMSNGFGMIIVILALTGFLTIGNERKLLKNIFLIALLLLVLFGLNFIVYANIVFCISAAYGFIWIINRKWELKNLNYWSVLLIICGILLMALSIDLKIASQRPDLKDFDALNSLKALRKGVVLSHEDYGFWIEYFSAKETLINNLNNFAKEDIANIFYGYNFSLSMDLIKKYKISYVFITPEMKSGLVWKKDDEGLLFLMKNSNRFNRIYNKNDYEIWEVLDEQG